MRNMGQLLLESSQGLLLGSLLVLGGTLLTASAAAEEYSILAGTYTDATTGESTVLGGGLELRSPGTILSDGTVLHVIDGFEFQVGDETFLPRVPVEYNDQVSLLVLQIADQIYFDTNRVMGFHARSGGELVEVNDDELTFRYFDFESTGGGGSSVSDPLPGSELPRRFQLRGTLYQVDQQFRIMEPVCLPILVPVIPPQGGSGGTIVISGGGSVGGSLQIFSSFDSSLDVTLYDAAIFIAPDLEVPAIIQETGSTIGRVQVHFELSAEPILISPEVAEFGAIEIEPRLSPLASSVAGSPIVGTASAHVIPTLEELNMSAPDGAEVTLDDDGLLTVASDGDITLFGPIPDISGLTEVRILAGGDIIATEDFEFSEDILFVLRADGLIAIEGNPEPPVIIPGDCDILGLYGLLPIQGTERTELGSFSITASTATRVEIDVMPRQRLNRLRLGSREQVAVALLGSEDFDVRDVDPDTLRLGPGNAEPLSRRGSSQHLEIRRVNRDRYRDLLTAFDVRDLRSSYGDTVLCLRAWTYSGEAIEGCDSIDAMPVAVEPEPRDRQHRGR